MDPVALQTVVAGRLRDELGGMTGVLRTEYNRIALAKSEVDRAEYDYYVLGHIHSLHGRGEPAAEIWKRGLERFPNSALLRYKLMTYHLYTRNAIRPAAELWEEAEKLEKKSRLDEWYRHWFTAALNGYRGKRQVSVTEARIATSMAPYDALSHNDLSWVLREAGEVDEALEWAKFSVTHDPNMYKFYFNALVSSYEAAKKWPEAVAFGEAQVIKDSVHAKWWYDFLVTAYVMTGQTDKATDARMKIKKLPEPPEP